MSEGSELTKPRFPVESKINPNKKEHGWLSPEGAFITCTPEEHDESARHIVDTNRVYFYDKFGEEVDDLPARSVLCRAGYIKVAGQYPDFFNTSGKITHLQYKLLKDAGYKIPEELNLDPTNLLPKENEILNNLSKKEKDDEYKNLVELFYNDPFTGFRTENLKLGYELFDLLSFNSKDGGKIVSSQNTGVVDIVWKKLGDGRVVLARELYHHVGDSPKDYGAADENITVYINTPDFVKNRIPEELQKQSL